MRKTARMICTSSQDNQPEEGQRLPISPEMMISDPLSTHRYPPVTLPELACFLAGFRASIYARIPRSQ